MEQNNTNTAPARPTFITVLCILTWIGCLFGLFGAIGNIGAGAVVSKMEAPAVQSSGNAELDASLSKVADAASSMTKYMSLIGWVSLVCVLLCAFGAFWMWKLKKTGFYIYTAGELIPVILSFALLGGMGAGGGIMASLGILMAIIPVAFVVMYGLNLKHMK